MAIADLPDEILFNHIFCRLPVKSILCFRSVCKAWNRMLREQQFVKLHLKIHQQQASNNKNKKLLIKTEKRNYYSIDCDEEAVESRLALPPPQIHGIFGERQSQLLGSCNGLVAIIVLNYNRTSSTLILWNPSIGETKYVVDTHPSIGFSDLYGFVYDSITDDYKIIRIISSSWFKECEVDIYSLKNNSWKKVKGVPYKCSFSLVGATQMAGVELNGYIYWMVMPPRRRFDQSITDFGFRDENLIFLRLPCDLICEKYRGSYYNASYVGLKAMGRSCIAAFRYYMNDELLVWTLKDPEKEENMWEKLITLSLSSPELEFTCLIRPLWFTKDGKVLLIIGFRGGDKDQHQYNFGVYDPQTKSLEFVKIYGIKKTSQVKLINEMGYIPSLVSPNMFQSGMRQVIDAKKRKRACPGSSR